MMKEDKKQPDNRRRFLKKGIAGMAGITMLPSLKAMDLQQTETSTASDDEKNSKLVYRTLGRTGIKVPIVSMGTSNNEYIIRAALKKGIVHFDSAYSYGKGIDETTFGRVFKGVARDSLVIVTKETGIRDGTGMPPENLSADAFKTDFRKNVETSLRRLQVDYVDVLYLHAADNPEYIKLDLVKEIMMELKNEGKAKYLGVSTHRAENIYTIVEQKIYDVILIAYNFRDEASSETRKAIEHAAKAGCGIVGMKALGGVYWDNERKQPINAKAAAKWILQDENVHTTIFTINTFEQLELYTSLMNEYSLTPEERKDLRLGEPTANVGLYCNHCERCIPQCRFRMDIPKIMRSYMYAYGYQKPSKAKETLELLQGNKIRCDECSSCSIDCPMGFNIKEKSLDIARIMDIPDEFLV